jgi:lipopolysaccharide transport system ATP-binding protein|tara:strand:+ start:349 stop:1083 length:735 start_codon:yes stop_codon:yes gene_type:complete
MIEAKNLNIEFPINTFKNFSLRKSLIQNVTRSLKVGGKISKLERKNLSVTALSELNFKIKEGDRVGIYGPNGSGKSTLLKTIAGVYPPTGGEILVTGKINNLLNIGFGFNSEASGRENAKFRLILAEYDDKEINDILERIKDFSGLDDYFDLPIKTYSSGMMFRLGFAIISQINGDIVLMDEWLSAGDSAFLEKVNNKLKDILKTTKILILASHSKELIKSNCNKILQLQNGKIDYYGDIKNDF